MNTRLQPLVFARDGAQIVTGVLAAAACEHLSQRIDASGQPGDRRLLQHDWCRQLATELQHHPDLQPLLPTRHLPVQCTCFDKSPDTNWLVSLHQDLSIPVRSRLDHPELTGWSLKDGLWYVQPPMPVLQASIAVRVHLDECGEHNGPLRIVPGSHHIGRLDRTTALATREHLGERTCHVTRGAALVMRPLLLHASSKSHGGRRRVLHFLFGPPQLPHGLQWP